MAKRDPLGQQKYWYDGAPASFIKTKTGVAIGGQLYWYNGQPQGYLTISTYIAKPRCFAVLIGF